MATETISFLDNPAQNDELDSEELYDSLAKLIRMAERPFVFAVVGLWGSGKTTLVDHALGKLNSEYQVIRFNAWSHSKGMPLLKALLVQMNNEKVNNEKNDIWKTVEKGLKSLAKSPIASATVRGIGSLAGPIGMILAEIGAKGFEGLNSQQDKEDQNDAVEEFISEFRKIAKNFDRAGKPLLFFIDDLDRCTPTESLDFIDDIKVYLTIDAPVIFIVAIDRRTLSMGIKAKYGTDSEIAVDDYLQKIFSYSINMPTFEKLDNLINKAISDVGKKKEELDLAKIAKQLITENEIKNIRSIKRIIRRWVFLIPSEVNRFLGEAGVRREITPEKDNLAQFVLLFCMLFELYPEYYESMMIFRTKTIDIISSALASEPRQSRPETVTFHENYLLMKGFTGNFGDEAKKRREENIILDRILGGLLKAFFLKHENLDIKTEGYKVSVTTIMNAVRLGLPLL